MSIHEETSPMDRFRLGRFSAPDRDCDIIMKGGVTSGVVYPKAILALAERYRFKDVGGTSAGGIAAAFTAAAEYARAKGEPDGFARLEARTARLPEVLSSLFQAEPRLQPLMRVLRLTIRRGLGWGAAAVPLFFWPWSLAGTLAGFLLLTPVGLLGAGYSGAVIAALIGLLASSFGGLVVMATKGVAANDFGVCKGLSDPEDRSQLALTDWLHESLQDIAFGAAAKGHRPLTFGDLEGPGTAHAVRLRMVTSNLSMRRPQTLPGLLKGLAFKVDRWKGIFPADVMSYLETVCGADPFRAKPQSTPPTRLDRRDAPRGHAMPVIVAVRMSLSFPFLVSAVPMVIRDIGKEKRLTLANGKVPGCIEAEVWMTDGGLTSNFPIHFFDGPLPMRPTFALSLDELPLGEPEPASRITVQTDAREGIFLPILPVRGVLGFGLSLLGVAKDWQDTLTAGMAGQRERIVRVSLTQNEGGLNLDMPVETSRKLMTYGEAAGQALLAKFNLEEHQWRRALVAYEQLETVASDFNTVWMAGFGAFFARYRHTATSYPKSTSADRATIEQRMAAFAALGAGFAPPIKGSGKFPKPSAHTRTAPKF